MAHHMLSRRQAWNETMWHQAGHRALFPQPAPAASSGIGLARLAPLQRAVGPITWRRTARTCELSPAPPAPEPAAARAATFEWRRSDHPAATGDRARPPAPSARSDEQEVIRPVLAAARRENTHHRLRSSAPPPSVIPLVPTSPARPLHASAPAAFATVMADRDPSRAARCPSGNVPTAQISFLPIWSAM